MVTSKHIFVLLSLIFFLNYHATAQDFFNDYKSYLINKKVITNKKKKSIELSVERLKLAVDSFKKEKHQLFFTSDTVYIVDFYGMETAYTSSIIWNKNYSCYYDYIVSIISRKVINKKLTIDTDASKILKSLKYDFRELVIKGDTLGYNKFAQKHSVFDGEAVSFTRAVKLNSHWRFLSSSFYEVDVNNDGMFK